MGDVAQIKWFGKKPCDTSLRQIHISKGVSHTAILWTEFRPPLR